MAEKIAFLDVFPFCAAVGDLCGGLQNAYLNSVIVDRTARTITVDAFFARMPAPAETRILIDRLCAEYGLFPEASDWRGRILLLESSEEKPSPEKYRKGLLYLKEAGVLEAVSGLLIGKPMDETYDAEYREILREVVDDPKKPILCNLPVGHATPRCILPFGIDAEVNADEQVIRFFY